MDGARCTLDWSLSPVTQGRNAIRGQYTGLYCHGGPKGGQLGDKGRPGERQTGVASFCPLPAETLHCNAMGASG